MTGGLVLVGVVPSPAAAADPVFTGPLAYASDGSHVRVIDTAAAAQLTTVAVPGAGNLTVSPDGRKVYVSSTAGITVIDATTNTVATTFPVTGGALGVSPDGTRLYRVAADLAVLNAATGAVLATYPVSGDDVVLPRNDRAYVSSPTAIKIVDPATGTILTTMAPPTNGQFRDLSVTRDGSAVWAVATFNRNVLDLAWKIDVASSAVVGGRSILAWSISGAVSPDGAKLWIVSSNSQSAVCDTSATTGANVMATPPPSGPVAVSSTGFGLLARNRAGGSVMVVDPATVAARDAALRTPVVPNYLAASPVAIPDTHGPGCDVEYIELNNKRARFHVFDTGAGLRSIGVAAATNVFSSSPPAFTAGTTSTVVADFVQQDPGLPTHVDLLLTDELGQTRTCSADIAGTGMTTSTTSTSTSTTSPSTTSPSTTSTSTTSTSTTSTSTTSTSTTSTSTTTTTVPPTTTTTTTIPPGPGTNLIEPDTATLEGSIGKWIPWYSATPSRSTASAHGGAHSLRVDVTASHGCGAELSNWPGFAAGPGYKELSFWARTTSSTGLAATMTIDWRDAAGNVLRSDALVVTGLGQAWKQASLIVDPPAGVASFTVELTGTGGAGDQLFFDDFVVAPTVTAPPPPPAPGGNRLDVDTATLEGSAGAWIPWFSSAMSRSTAQAHGGSASLQVDIAAPYGWGVQQSNWPGFAATPGTHRIGFWALAPTSAGLGVTMQVDWRDTAGNVLQTDTVTVGPLSASWQQASALVDAPAGTQRVTAEFVHTSGGPGDTLFLDDVVVAPVTNALDADTATLEGSAGAWAPWFSSAVSRSTAQAHSGAASLEVDVTASYGWGVQQSNWPGFATAAGSHQVSFWALSMTPGLGVTMQVNWRDAAGTVLQSDTVTVPLPSGTWQEGSALLIAPVGTARVTIDFLHASGGPGDTVFVDDITVY